MPISVNHVYSQTVADGTATSVVRPSDWNSSHVVNVPRLSGFEPFNMLNPASTTYAPAIGTWYFQPFVLPMPLASGQMRFLFSQGGTAGSVLRASNGASYASNTTGTWSKSQNNATSYALYSLGTGTNSTRLESVWSNTWGVSIHQSGSIILTAATHVRATYAATITYVVSIDSAGAYTTGSLSGSASSSSASVSMATAGLSAGVSSLMNKLSGAILTPVGLNTSLEPGHWWMAYAWSSSSTTSGSSIPDSYPQVHMVGLYGISSMPYRQFGLTVSNTSMQHWLAQGIYSVASASPPATVNFTQIRSVVSHVTCYFNIINQSMTA